MNCDPIARAYAWLEYASFGRALRGRREEFLGEVADARRVLMLGDGDGRFLAAFLRRNSGAEVDSVDSSAGMLAIARNRVEGAVGRAALERQVRFHHADAKQWRPPAGACYDLIVTHFFLDCFPDGELAEMIPPLAHAAAPGARWLVSEFRQPSHGLARARARIWIWALYAAFRLATGLRVRRLPDYGNHLQGQGFVRERAVISGGGLLTSELWRRGGTE